MSKDEIDDVREMIKMYQVMQHQNVVQMEDWFETTDLIYIVLELHSNVTFDHFIWSVEMQLEEEFIREYTIKIGQTVSYLHDIGVIIRNLDCKSFLMSENTRKGVLAGALPRLSKIDHARVMGVSGDY